MTLKQEWTAYQTIVLVELKRIIRIWSQTLLPPAITSILYFVIFGQVIDRYSRRFYGGDYKYIQFIAPSLIMVNIITSSYTSAIFAFLERNFSEILKSYIGPGIQMSLFY